MPLGIPVPAFPYPIPFEASPMYVPAPLLRRFAAFLVPLFVAAGAHGALPAGVTQGPSIEGVTEYRLANGLTVLLFPDASKPTTTVNVTYKVGAAHENYGETGMAHLLEHLMFKGTPTSGNILTELGKRGMQFNGTTGWDRTNYFESFTASPQNLDWALQMEADRMVNSYIRRSDLDTEMTVVRNEFESGENNPQSVLYGKMLATAYQWHNYGHLPIGARSDIENVNIERLQAFYRMYYQPDNAVLIVAGKFDPDATLAKIASTFGPIAKPARTLPTIYTVEPVQDGERGVTLRRAGNSKFLALMFHTVRGAHPDQIAADVLGDVLTVEPAGRLYKTLVETKKATAVESDAQPMQDPGTLTLWAQIPDTDQIAPARDAMFATIEDLKKNPVTEAEVARIRAKNLKYFDEVLSNPQAFAVAISGAVGLGDWRMFFIERDRYRTVAAADVQRVALEYLKRSNVTIGEFIPDAKPDRAPVPPPVDLAAMVKDYKGDDAATQGETFDTNIANLEARTQRFTLPNGMKVALLPKKTRGEGVNFSLALHFADEKAAFGKQADGQFTGSMLMRGTAKKSRQEIEDTLDKLRAQVSVGGSETGATASGKTFRKELPETLRLVAQVLREPSFPAQELDTLKRERATELEDSRMSPQRVASRALRREANPYKAGDPRYAPTVDEELAWAKTVTPESMRKFHDAFYGASNGELAIVGDFDPAEMRALVTKLFGSWKSPTAYARVPDPLVPKPAVALKLELADKANAFLLGREALQLNDLSPDYPAMLVANFILGDSSTSRLWERLRQKDGVSYSVGSQFQPNSFEANSRLVVYAIFAPENLDKVRRGMSEELASALKNGFTDVEVANAKDALMQERRLGRNEDSQVAGTLSNQAYLGRTWSTSAQVDAAIEKLTTADVNAALRKYVKPDDLAYAFAGEFAKKK
jgi:zinc protease